MKSMAVFDPQCGQFLKKPEGRKRIVNVAQVKQLSPFRYPGGKTWLIPEIKKWLRSIGYRPAVFVEPFAGGSIASLTVAVFSLADKVVMVELDGDVAAVWEVILDDAEWLCKRIKEFKATHENVTEVLNGKVTSSQDIAFRSLLRNRMQRGGIMSPGASLIKKGENGKGLLSRWYPATLVDRIRTIQHYRKKIEFVHGDGFAVIEQHLEEQMAAFFVDPPYTAGGARAGRRLYLHNVVDHERLFKLLSRAAGRFLMTYDDAGEVVALAEKYNFKLDRVPMKNTHHLVKYELLITPET
ncbi:MAG TPA: DNA adenine methylase, partial [Syntrophobacteraceae bacterium]|nr:DNA adenine methylase [Syntrophobacteraceae bacterium]